MSAELFILIALTILGAVFFIGYITGWITHARVMLRHMEDLESKRGKT